MITGFLHVNQARSNACLKDNVSRVLGDPLPFFYKTKFYQFQTCLNSLQSKVILLTDEFGESKKKKLVRSADKIQKIAINRPGELCIVTEMPSKLKFICLNRIVRQGPRRRPICRHAKQMNFCSSVNV